MKKTAAALLAAGIVLSAGITASATDSPTVKESNAVVQLSPMTSATILSACIDALENGSYGGETEHYTYAYYYGSPSSLQKYSNYSNDLTDALDRMNGSKTLVNRWLSQSIVGESTIIKLTAKTDLTLHLTSDSDASHKYICWSPDSYFEYIVEGQASDGKTYRISLERRFALVDAAKNSYATEITLKAGDSFLFLFGSDFKTAKSASRWIGFSVTTDYDASKRPDFDAMPAVMALREEKLADLTRLANAVSAEAGFSADSVAAARAALADAPRRLERTKTTAEVTAVYESIARSIELCQRLTVTDDALQAAVFETCSKLDALMASVDRSKYAAVYSAVEECYYEGLEKTYAATTPSNARYQYSVYQNKILTLLYACEKGGNA